MYVRDDRDDRPPVQIRCHPFKFELAEGVEGVLIRVKTINAKHHRPVVNVNRLRAAQRERRRRRKEEEEEEENKAGEV